MKTFFALLAVCAGNSPVNGEFPAQSSVTRSFDFFWICIWINRLVNIRAIGDLRRYRTHCDVNLMCCRKSVHFLICYKEWYVSVVVSSADYITCVHHMLVALVVRHEIYQTEIESVSKRWLNKVSTNERSSTGRHISHILKTSPDVRVLIDKKSMSCLFEGHRDVLNFIQNRP